MKSKLILAFAIMFNVTVNAQQSTFQKCFGGNQFNMVTLCKKQMMVAALLAVLRHPMEFRHGNIMLLSLI